MSGALKIVSVQVGRVQERGALKTAFGKSPVEGPVHAGKLGLDGDAQANRVYHGGPEMALLAYAFAHYPRWREELAWPGLPLGGFGENLTVLGVDEEQACIGDVLRAGSALLQISSPRKPCSKIAQFWQRPALLEQVHESGRIGWYLRVLEEGALQAGDALTVVERPAPEWTVLRAYRTGVARKAMPQDALALADAPGLSDRWRAWLRGEPAKV